MKFSDKLYDILKWVCLIAIPALVVLLSAVLPVLGVEAGMVKNITLIISAVGAFVGTLIGISTTAYNAQQTDEWLKVGGTDE